jgi:putative spermidine/putrescine transport system ATP-binding protein
MTSTQPAARLGTQNSAGGARVELRGVVKEFAGHRALNEIQLTIEPGEFVALLGPSGCGKTTALRVVAGLESATTGDVLINDEAVSDLPASKRDIGMVFQSYSLFPHLSVLANVEFGLRMRKVPAAERLTRSAEALDLVGLGHLHARYAHQLSGGQQQRVALARALVTRPRVLLLDEPLSALDAKVRVQLRDEIRRIQTDLGITTLFVTHDQEEALAVADRVAVMNAGQIEQIGTPEDLYDRASSPFVAEFVGLSNRVNGIVNGNRVLVAGTSLPLINAGVSNGPVVAFVRPEDIELSVADPIAVVVASSFLGAYRRTSVRLDDGALVQVQHAANTVWRPGDRVGVGYRGAAVTVRSGETA